MAKIQLSDLSGSASLNIKDSSLAAQRGLSELKAEATDVVTALDRPLQQQPIFREAKLAAAFGVPSTAVSGGGAAATAKATAASVLRVSRCADTPLFGKTDFDPVSISGNDCWMTFELDTAISAGVKLPLPDGFGVSASVGAAPKFATHMRFPGNVAATLPLREAVSSVLSTFQVLDSVDAVLNVPADTIYVNDIGGTVTIGASWQFPLALTQTCLASQPLPFGQCATLKQSDRLSLQGSIGLQSEFSVRVWRVDAGTLHFGLYRKKSVTLTAQFSAGAGVTGNVTGTDLIQTIFSAIAPGANTKALPADEALEIQSTLKESVNRSLSIAMNAQCAAIDADEAMLVYSMDVSNISQAQKEAVAQALRGDWSGFGDPAVAHKIRDVVRDTVEHKTTLRLNFLGIYNHESVDDLIREMKVLKNDETGEITITDKATAKRILVDSSALAKPADRLRRAAYEGFVATVTYQALMKGVGTDVSASASQSYFVYREQMGRADVSACLRAGEALGLMPAGKRAEICPNNNVSHARFSASREYQTADVFRLFFADAQQLTPRKADDLAKLGRQCLVALIEPKTFLDPQRIAQFSDERLWAQMVADPVNIDVHFKSDYLSIREWADAISKTGPLLADIITYARKVKGDPTVDKTFQQKRQALEKNMANVVKSANSNFDPAFAICAMSKLAGDGGSGPGFEADWDGKTMFASEPLTLSKAATGQPV